MRWFNAATAMMPWRTRSSHAVSRQADKFNAATAMMPWRTLGNGSHLKPFFSVQCGHGDDAVENPVLRASPHRSGYTFNAATAMMPWRTFASCHHPPGRHAVQCGHGDDAVE